MAVTPPIPKDLQDAYDKMRPTELGEYSMKMFSALLNEGLADEPSQLLAATQLMLTSPETNFPPVVFHTLFIELYAKAGKTKDAYEAFLAMIRANIEPNSYTYGVLIKALAADPKLFKFAQKYVMEMMNKGMKPNAGTYTAVFEGFVGKAAEGKIFLMEMEAKGFQPEEEAVRKVLVGKSGQVASSVLNLLFGPFPTYKLLKNNAVLEFTDEKMKQFNGMYDINTVANFTLWMFDILALDNLPQEEVAQAFHTFIISKYAVAGSAKDTLEAYQRMLLCPTGSRNGASLVVPHRLTYDIVIEALAADSNFLADAKNYLLEMLAKGMTPRTTSWTAVFEGFAIANKAEEFKDFLEELKAKWHVVDEKYVRKTLLQSKSELEVTTIINILFGK